GRRGGRCGRASRDGGESGLTLRRKLPGIALEATHCLGSAWLNPGTMRYEVRAASRSDRVLLLASWIAKRARLRRNRRAWRTCMCGFRFSRLGRRLLLASDVGW